MINHVCIKGGKCKYYEERIQDYFDSNGNVRGKMIFYYCIHPKKAKGFDKVLNYEKNMRSCKFKITNVLEEFINV